MFNFWAFLRKKWSEYSDVRGQKGTLIDDLAIKPTGLVMSDFYNLLVNQRNVNDVTKLGARPDDDIDFFGGKFFIPRILGGYAFGIVRIWFNSKIDILLTEAARFISTNGLQFVVAQPGRISKNSFQVSTDRVALFYVDVPVIAAAKGTGYNIVAGDISQLINVDFEYHSTTNQKDFLNGSKYETNEEYLDRLKYSVNDRSMTNQKSLSVNLPALFPIIKAMYIAGAGDRYMTRDLIAGFDSSEQFNRVDFLGKSTGDNIVKHVGFYGLFPPNVGSVYHDRFWGPHSAVSAYDNPLTIDQAVTGFNPEEDDEFKSDPAFLGFPLNQEFTDSMYRGIYFNDFKRFFENSTDDLFNFDKENIGSDKVLPDNTWIWGACGRNSGNVGPLEDGLGAIDVINMSSGTIRLCGGALESLSVSKDINKRTGVKLTGSFTIPDASESGVVDSNLQIMVGGVNEPSLVDGYTGIGFGVRLTDDYNNVEPNQANAVIYFAHSEKYGTAQVYATDEDFNDHISVSDIGALAEKGFRIQSGAEYTFEFIIYDDLRLTLLIKKNPPTIADMEELENTFRFELPKKVLGIFSDSSNGGILAIDSTRYGTMMKVTLDTTALLPTIEWAVTGLKAFDMNPERAMALLSIDVTNIESPITIYARAYGNSAVGNSQSDGYRALIWDKEEPPKVPGSSELTQGGWVEADGISDPGNVKKTLTGLLAHHINNIDRYVVNSRYGRSIFILFTTSGTSKPAVQYNGDLRDDIKALLRVDYIKVESDSVSMYHANNKADIYLATLSNAEEYRSTITTLRKNPGDTYFEMSLDKDCAMPVFEIVAITTGESLDLNNALAESEYTITDTDLDMVGSSFEAKRISLNESNVDTITIEYKSYPTIKTIQDYFDDMLYKKLYGNVLVKHKYPCELDISLFYTGISTEDNIINAIKEYVDSNIDSVFVTKNLVSYLYNEGLVNNVKEPVTILYTKYDDELSIKSGSFTNQLSIRPIDFFRIVNITVQRL